MVDEPVPNAPLACARRGHDCLARRNRVGVASDATLEGGNCPREQGAGSRGRLRVGHSRLRETARIAPVVSSPIRAVRVEEGEMVRRGQVLAELVDNPERASALQMRAEANRARAAANRTQRLHAQGFASEAAWDDARRQAESAAAAAQAAEAVL